jgi:hypothetical protein
MAYKENSNKLCSSCKKATGLCSWSREFKPVDGWTATPTKLLIGKNKYTDSFYITACPEYEMLDYIKEYIVENSGKVRNSRNIIDK